MTNDRFPARSGQPAEPDPADLLNDALDGAAAGGTDAGIRADLAAVAPLLAVAGRLRTTPLDEHETEMASVGQLDAIWDTVLARTASHPATVRPAPEPAVPVRGRSRVMGIVSVPPRPDLRRSRIGAVSSWISLAAIVAVLIGMGSMAWSLRPGGGEGHLLASATSLVVGTAYASPSPAATGDVLRWPEPADCTAAPMPLEGYAEVMRVQPDISGRSYEVAGTPSEADAVAAASAANAWYACVLYGSREQVRTLSSPAYTFFQSYSAARTVSDQELRAGMLEHGMLLSATAPVKPPSAYGIILAAAPSEQLLAPSHVGGRRTPLIAVAYSPDNALLLADGRVAVPGTALYWKDDYWQPQQWQIDESDALSTSLVILTNESGAWTVDESLTFCPYAGCLPTWEQIAGQWQVPLPTLDIPVPWGTGGTATPAASPANDGTATPAA